MFRRKKGSALAQYGIVLILVAVATLVVYFTLGKNIVSYLTNFSSVLNDNNTTIESNMPVISGVTSTSLVTPPTSSGTIINASGLGGSPSDPQTSCTSGMCSIDYGTHVFNGIPEDFSAFVETSGSTAGTDVVLALLDDIVKAAEEGDIPMSADELAKVRLLAEKGHNLANGERALEDFIKDDDISTLVSSAISATGQRSKIDMDAEVLALCEGEQFREALNTFKSYSETEVNPAIQTMVSTLADHIQTLYDDFDSRTQLMYWNTEVDSATAQAAYQSFFASHQVSGLSNLKSTIICGVGNGDDTGVSCNP